MARRALVATAASIVVLAPLAWFWQASLMPGTYSIMDGHGGHQHHGRGVHTLVADPARAADVRVTLVARKERFRLPSGRAFDGYTVNGTSPGPTVRAVQGQLVEVTLVNESVPDGATVHWHGIDVPNAADGVAGVTQDAVPPGGSFTYRFVAEQAGTYWYHSHQVSHEQVQKGLLGAVVIEPGTPRGGVVALVHRYGAVRTVNGYAGDVVQPSAAGERARVRVINTDNGPMTSWVTGAPFTLAAIDGTEVREPAPVTGQGVLVTSGGRADIEVVVPEAGARIELGGDTAIVLSPPGSVAGKRSPAPARMVDPLAYGAPAAVAPIDPGRVNREHEYSIGRRPGFLDGRPGLWWTVNGRMFPDVPDFRVAEGDVVRFTVSNHSGEVHPMHLHGHHALVTSRDGVPATGSPWWTDSLNVASGETYEIVFVADNPGLWMDHCHNLPHAAQGLMAHVSYEGVTTPFLIGGPAANSPE
ncbi:multicopper oxidase family protein [Longispora albida]|uniref:multicopper oxidase family protein n=1 Tax=Longispora albida TaxID=203523 RepID=UPI00036128B5|nr:multicopper oxidase family protein [Longispora albida]